MSRKRISLDDARVISVAMSRKAFEHLIKPTKARLNDTLLDAYRKITAGWHADTLTSMKAHLSLDETSVLGIKISDGKRYLRLNLEGEGFIANLNHWGASFYIVDADLYDKVVELSGELAQLREKRSRLQGEIEKQIVGRSAKTVIETWPEAESFINDHFGSIGDTVAKPTMTTPLDALLARFLPALPAPVSEGV